MSALFIRGNDGKQDRDQNMKYNITFDKGDSLFQTVGIFVAVVEDVGPDGEANCAIQERIDLIDCVQHGFQSLM